jgi:hypothetical protein
MGPLETTPGQDTPGLIGFRDERFAASYLAVSVETLRTWRKQNRGPRFRRLGRCVRYSSADLLAFVEAAPSGGGEVMLGPAAVQMEFGSTCAVAGIGVSRD